MQPTNKEMHEFASKIKQLIQNKIDEQKRIKDELTTTVPSSVDTNKIFDLVKQIEKTILDNEEIHTNELDTTLRQYEEAINRLEIVVDDLLNLKCFFKKAPFIKSIVEELTKLSNIFPAIKLENTSMILTTQNIVVGNVDFGPFEITLNLIDSVQHDEIPCIALSPKPHRINPNIVHPRVCDQKLMLLVREHTTINNCCKHFKLSELCKTIVDTLQSGQSYHASVEDWFNKPITPF